MQQRDVVAAFAKPTIYMLDRVHPAAEVLPMPSRPRHDRPAIQEAGVGELCRSDLRSILSSEIMAYRHLPDDWDGEGGLAPSKEAIDDALAFIDLLPLRAKLPKPTVSGDGEVGFYWKTGNGYINVSFFGDGQIIYYGHAVSNDMEVGGVKPYNRTSLPKDLLEMVDRA
jgi:hypothetical protein